MSKKLLVIAASAAVLAGAVTVVSTSGAASLVKTPPDCSLAQNALLPACSTAPKPVSGG